MLVSLSAPALARADTPQQIEARARFSRGVDAFARGSFDQAVHDFKASYQLRAVPIALFNIAESYTALDRFDEAVAYLELFTAAVPAETLEPAQRDQVAQLTQRIRKASGTVRVVEAPEGSSVTVDGRDTPAALLRPVYVPVGRHAVVVNHPDFTAFRQAVQVATGDGWVLKAVMPARPRDATLRVLITPRDALVLVDGKAASGGRREGAATVLSLRPGLHELAVRKPGMTSFETTMELRSGESREVSSELLASPRAGILRSPWFWAGVGVIAGGAIGFGVARATQ